jgi:hypothetical protein
LRLPAGLPCGGKRANLTPSFSEQNC